MKVEIVLTPTEIGVLRTLTGVYHLHYVPSEGSEYDVLNKEMVKQLVRAETRKTSPGRINVDREYLEVLLSLTPTLYIFDYHDLPWAHSASSREQACDQVFGRLTKVLQGLA